DLCFVTLGLEQCDPLHLTQTALVAANKSERPDRVAKKRFNSSERWTKWRRTTER
ncbi:hypothetical protein A2U01_0115979, partial [Trifolium medium]|nr:hypothetical protein [Trifolium medium]